MSDNAKLYIGTVAYVSSIFTLFTLPKIKKSEREGSFIPTMESATLTFYCYKMHAPNKSSLCTEIAKNAKSAQLPLRCSSCVFMFSLYCSVILSRHHKRLSTANLILSVNNIPRQFSSVSIVGLNWIPNQDTAALQQSALLDIIKPFMEHSQRYWWWYQYNDKY